MLRDELNLLAAFAVVADERSFTKAATRLGVSTSAVSHSIRGLEERLGVRLLARTTRTVAPTDAGERLLAQLRPALDEIGAALTEVGRLRERPAGALRLIAPPIAAAMAVSPKLAKFAAAYPDVVLDITTEDDSRRDLVAGRFDAGIHLGEFVQRDMVAVKVTREQRAAIVASPAYFKSHPKPKTPRDLTAHLCIRYRMGVSGPVYRWEFEKRGKPVTVAVSGPLICNDVELTVRAALDGVGLAFALGSGPIGRIRYSQASSHARGARAPAPWPRSWDSCLRRDAAPTRRDPEPPRRVSRRGPRPPRGQTIPACLRPPCRGARASACIPASGGGPAVGPRAASRAPAETAPPRSVRPAPAPPSALCPWASAPRGEGIRSSPAGLFNCAHTARSDGVPRSASPAAAAGPDGVLPLRL